MFFFCLLLIFSPVILGIYQKKYLSNSELYVGVGCTRLFPVYSLSAQRD